MPKHRPVQVLIKPASAECNLACRYCFYLEKQSLYPEAAVHRMSPEVQLEMTRQMLMYGGSHPAFAYQGGEPTLMGLDFYRRGIEMIQKHGSPGMTVGNSIQTNGILIDEHWAEFLARYRFLVGLSIDGPAHIHDHYRLARGGQPSHEHALRAAALFDAYGVEYNILAVVNSYSCQFPEEIYDYFTSQRWSYMQFIPTVEFDPTTGKLAEFSVSPEDYGKFLCAVFDKWLNDFKDGRPTTSVRLFDNLLAVMLGQAASSCTQRRTCGIYVVIEYNGDVYPCDFFVEPKWKLGNLMRQSLRGMLESPRMREFGALKANLVPECRECEWLPLCHGGCTKDRMRSSAPGNMGKDYFCAAHRMFFEYSREKLENLKKTLG